MSADVTTYNALGGQVPLYAARFDVVPEEGDASALVGILEQTVLKESRGVLAEQGAAPGARRFTGWSDEPARGLSLGTEVTLGPAGPRRVPVLVRTCWRALPGNIVSEALIPVAKAPDLVRSLLYGRSWHAEKSGAPLAAEPQAVSADELQTLANWIMSPARPVPVVMVGSAGDGAWPVDPRQVTSLMAGLAQVRTFNHSDDVLASCAAVLPVDTPSVPGLGEVAVYAPLATGLAPQRFSGWRGLARRNARSLASAVAHASREVGR